MPRDPVDCLDSGLTGVSEDRAAAFGNRDETEYHAALPVSARNGYLRRAEMISPMIETAKESADDIRNKLTTLAMMMPISPITMKEPIFVRSALVV